MNAHDHTQLSFPNNKPVTTTRRAHACFNFTGTCLLLAAGLGLGTFASAAPILWTDPAGGTFSDGTNWSSGLPPSATDEAVFDLGPGGVYTVNFTSSPTTRQVRVLDDTVLFDLGGNTYAVTTSLGANAPSIVVGDSNGDTSALTLVEGTLKGVDTGIGIAAGSTGSLSVSFNAMLMNSAGMNVGLDGRGNLTILRSGDVSNTTAGVGVNAGSSGTVTVTGAGSTWTNSSTLLVVGDEGRGEMTIQNGGAVSTAFGGTVGQVAGSTGTVTVTGTGSTWTNGSALYVGDRGTGTMNILDGGAVSNLIGAVGYNSGAGTVTVNGVGSTWTSSSFLLVGGIIGTGTMNILEGGAVSNEAGTVGLGTGSTGTVTVSGVGSTWTNSSSVIVGDEGTGTMNILDGGAVSNAVGTVGREAGSTGTVTVTGTGSTWTNGSTLYVGDRGTGTMNIFDGGAVSNTTSIVGYDGVGTVTVNGVGSTWTSSSDVIIGEFSTGTVNVQNGATVSSRLLLIGIVASGTVVVDGADSSWSSSGDFYVGHANTGSLTISNGGSVSNPNAFIGATPGSNGTATVGGAGATWSIADAMYVGGNNISAGGTGLLDINPGGTVDIANALTIWTDGTVNVNGGTLNTGSIVMAGSAFNFNAGIVNFANDLSLGNAGPLGSSFTLSLLHNLSVTGTTTIDPFSVLTLDGGSFSTGVLANNGGFFQFNSGTFSLTNADLTIGAGGPFGSSLQLNADQTVNVSNIATVEGGALLSLNNGAFNVGNTLVIGG